jgi:hypothetical protein
MSEGPRCEVRCSKPGAGDTRCLSAPSRISKAPWRASACVAFALLPFCGLGQESSNAIPNLRPPRAEVLPTFWEQHGWWWIVAIAVVLAILVGAAVWFFLRPRQPVVVPPAVLARRELEPLQQQAEDGFVLSRVSQVLRRYIAAACGLPLEEVTTTEFCAAIRGQDRIGPALADAISDFLCQCDTRKFAPPAQVPSLATTVAEGSAVKSALVFIEQAEARLSALALADADAGSKREVSR